MKMRSQNLIRSKELELIKAPQRTPKRKHTIAESRAEKNKCKRIITIYQSNSNHSMAITTSGSIDIYGSAACDQEKVSRAMPAILSGRITSDDWSVLCNDLDEALKPSSGVKKLIHAWNAIVPLVFLIFLIFGFLGFASASADKKGFNWSSLIVAVLIAVLGNLCVLFIKLVEKNKIQKKLVAVCEKTSTSHPDISFHVRYQMRRDSKIHVIAATMMTAVTATVKEDEIILRFVLLLLQQAMHFTHQACHLSQLQKPLLYLPPLLRLPALPLLHLLHHPSQL